MSKEYPLFPQLNEEAQKEAQDLIDKFKGLMKKAADDVLSELYCDVACYIESDTWTNFRNELMDGFKNYDNKKIQGEYDFKELRQAIYKNHKEEIVNDLNQDMVNEIESLNERIRTLQYGGY
jgi:hypothetical protein